MIKIVVDNGCSIASKKYSVKQYTLKEMLQALSQRRVESNFCMKVNRERRGKGLDQLDPHPSGKFFYSRFLNTYPKSIINLN